MFEKAVRQKIRFDHKGSISVEDVWDLDITALDAIYRPIKKALDAIGEDSLLDAAPHKEKALLQLKVEILKHVVEVKKTEAKKRTEALARKQKVQQFREVLARKQNQEIENLPAEKIAEMLAELEAE